MNTRNVSASVTGVMIGLLPALVAILSANVSIVPTRAIAAGYAGTSPDALYEYALTPPYSIPDTELSSLHNDGI
jgi:hypothetical protein